jgi:hypothetical protein
VATVNREAILAAESRIARIAGRRNLRVAASAKRVTRRSALGACLLGFDSVRFLLRTGRSMLQRAEERGSLIEDELLRRYHHLEDHPPTVMGRVQRASGEDHSAQLTDRRLESTLETNSEVERQVKIVLARRGIPSRTRLSNLENDVDRLTAKIDRRLAGP